MLCNIFEMKPFFIMWDTTYARLRKNHHLASELAFNDQKCENSLLNKHNLSTDRNNINTIDPV